MVLSLIMTMMMTTTIMIMRGRIREKERELQETIQRETTNFFFSVLESCWK